MSLNHAELVRRNKAFTLTTWTAQKDWQPVSMVRGEQALVDQIAETIEYEGPSNIAAILLEGYSGIMQGGDVYWQGIQALCEHYGILLIIDEVMNCFDRTAKWFGVKHDPFVKPDIMVVAKGLTSGYMPLGAVAVHDKVGAHFENNTL